MSQTGLGPPPGSPDGNHNLHGLQKSVSVLFSIPFSIPFYIPFSIPFSIHSVVDFLLYGDL